MDVGMYVCVCVGGEALVGPRECVCVGGCVCLGGAIFRRGWWTWMGEGGGRAVTNSRQVVLRTCPDSRLAPSPTVRQ